MSDVRPPITERQATHGSFADNANVAQAIKNTIRYAPNWSHLHPSQREALDLIASKIGRIMSGDPYHGDHWLDISGYAQLGLEVCRDGEQ